MLINCFSLSLSQSDNVTVQDTASWNEYNGLRFPKYQSSRETSKEEEKENNINKGRAGRNHERYRRGLK